MVAIDYKLLMLMMVQFPGSYLLLRQGSDNSLQKHLKTGYTWYYVVTLLKHKDRADSADMKEKRRVQQMKR